MKSGPVLENRMRKIVFLSDAAIGYHSRQWPLQSQNHAQNVHTFFFPASLPCVNSDHNHISIFLHLQAVLIPDVIDVEAPEYLATDLLLLLYMEPDPRCSRCFKAALPVHGRYHRPAEETEEALIVLKSPEVLVCCCDSEIVVTCSFGEQRNNCGQSRAWNLSSGDGALSSHENTRGR